MSVENLQSLIKLKKWADVEREWMAAIDAPISDPAPLLGVIDQLVAASQNDLATTLAWTWLSLMKENHTPAQALQLGRGLLLRLPDGDQLREEILSLYRQTHTDKPDLEDWIDRSGLKAGKSVRRALGYLTTALRLTSGAFVIHKTDDVAGEITALDAAANSATIRTDRRTQTLPIDRLIDEYEITPDNDFRVLNQLHPDKLAQLVADDPITLVMGILRCHSNRLDRDELKLLLVPRHVPADKWSDWWGRVRNGVKRSPHLQIEGRSPMFLVYNPAGVTPEAEAWAALQKAATPREWLDLLESYLRDSQQQKRSVDTDFLNRIQTTLVERIERFRKQRNPEAAFATALVIERVAADGLPVSTDAHGMALAMLREAADPVAMVASASDSRLWSLAVPCVEQAFPGNWADHLAELILFAPAGQCDVLARKVEQAGRGELLVPVAERALAEPGRFTDALMWLWKGPTVETSLPLPPRQQMFSLIIGLVGPARSSQDRAVAQTTNEMRAKIRAGFAAKDYAPFRECLEGLEPAMAMAIRRQLERAEGLGPRAQDEMVNILRAKFPRLEVKIKIDPWDDESILYFTAKGLKIKEDELHQIVNVKMRENAKAIGEAAAHGDLSENSEYKFALEERDLLRARVAQLNSELSIARVLEPHLIPEDMVGIGHRLLLQPTDGGAPVTMSILGANDTDLPSRTYSYKTPIARQVLGKRPGDVIHISFGDHEGEYRIDRLESALTQG